MKDRSIMGVSFALALFILLSGLSNAAFGKEVRQDRELLNPEGVIKIDPMEINPHPVTLEGKTAMLRWNGKHNGNHFLDTIAERLSENIKDVKILKSWKVAPETVDPITGSQERSRQFAEKLAEFKPDIVIAAQAD